MVAPFLKELECGLCHQTCKRGVKLSCCGARGCRACTVKAVTKSRKCWKGCGAAVSTEHVLNDEELRLQVEELTAPGNVLKCTVCREVCKRAAILSCCYAQCCRNCGQKKVTQDRVCWTPDCKKENLVTDDLINDVLLRDAVAYFKENGEVNTEHYDKIWERIQEKSEERRAIAAAAAAAANEALDNMSDLSESEGIIGAPPMRLDPTVRQAKNYFSHLRARALRLGINTASSVVDLRERLLSLAKPEDEQVLLEFLPKHLLIECEGDGACLFNGIDGLITGEFNGERMRKICLQAFNKDRDKYNKYLDLHHDVSECPGMFCTEDGKTHKGKILKSLVEPCFVMVDTADEYIREMSKPSTFGTNFEMHVLADKLQMELMIITKNESGRGNPLYYNHYRPSGRGDSVLNQLVLYSQDLHFEPVVVEMDEYDDDDPVESEDEEDDIEDEVEEELVISPPKVKNKKGKGNKKKKGKQKISLQESSEEDEEYDERRKNTFAMMKGVPQGVPKTTKDKKGELVLNPNIAPLGPRKTASFGGKVQDLKAVTLEALPIPKGVPKATKDKKGNVTENPNVAPLGPRKSLGVGVKKGGDVDIMKWWKQDGGLLDQGSKVSKVIPVPKGVPKATTDKKGEVIENPNIAPLGPRKTASFGGKVKDIKTVTLEALPVPKGVPLVSQDKKGNVIENPNVAPLGPRKSLGVKKGEDVGIMKLWKQENNQLIKSSERKWDRKSDSENKQFDKRNDYSGDRQIENVNESKAIGRWNPKGPNGKIKICFTCQSKMHLDPDCSLNNKEKNPERFGKIDKCITCCSEWHNNFKCPRKEYKNPVGVNGKIERCQTCDSILHLSQDCPHFEIKETEDCNELENFNNIKDDDSAFENSREMLRNKFEGCDLRNKLDKTDLRNKLSKEGNLNNKNKNDVDVRDEVVKSRRSSRESRFSRGKSVNEDEHTERLNPMKDGKVLTCFICDSVTHFDNDCLYKKELFSLRNSRGMKCKNCCSSMHIVPDCPHGAFENKMFDCAMCGSQMHNVNGCPHKFKLKEKIERTTGKSHPVITEMGKLTSKFDSHPKRNPVGYDGKIQACIVCESKLHLAKDCRHDRRSKKNPVLNNGEPVACQVCDSMMHLRDDCPDKEGGRSRHGSGRSEERNDTRSHRKSLDQDQDISKGISEIRMEMERTQARGRRWDAQTWDYNTPARKSVEHETQWRDDHIPNRTWKMNADRHQHWDEGERYVRRLDSGFDDSRESMSSRRSSNSNSKNSWENAGDTFARDKSAEIEQRLVRQLNEWEGEERSIRKVENIPEENYSASNVMAATNYLHNNELTPHVVREQRHVRMIQEDELTPYKAVSTSNRESQPVARQRISSEEPYSSKTQASATAFPPNSFYSNYMHQVPYPVPPPYQLNQHQPPPLPSQPPPLPSNPPSHSPVPFPGQPPLPKYPPTVKSSSSSAMSTNLPLALQSAQPPPPPLPLNPPLTLAPPTPPKPKPAYLRTRKPAPIKIMINKYSLKPAEPPTTPSPDQKPVLEVELPPRPVSPPEMVLKVNNTGSPYVKSGRDKQINPRKRQEKQIDPNDKHADYRKRKRHSSGENGQGSKKGEVEMDENLYSDIFSLKEIQDDLNNTGGSNDIKTKRSSCNEEKDKSDSVLHKEINGELDTSISSWFQNKKHVIVTPEGSSPSSSIIERSVRGSIEDLEKEKMKIQESLKQLEDNEVIELVEESTDDEKEPEKQVLSKDPGIHRQIDEKKFTEVSERRSEPSRDPRKIKRDHERDPNEEVKNREISRDPRKLKREHERDPKEGEKDRDPKAAKEARREQVEFELKAAKEARREQVEFETEVSRDPRKHRRDRNQDRDQKEEGRDNSSKEERRIRLVKEDCLPSGMQAVEERGNTHSKRWPATRLGKYHELKFKDSQRDELLEIVLKNTVSELIKRAEDNDKATAGKIMKLTKINADVLVRGKDKKPKKEKKKKKRRQSSSSSSSENEEKVKDNLETLKRTEKMVVDNAFTSTIEIIFAQRVMDDLKKQEERLREDLTNRFDVRRQKEERYMNQDLDKIKKQFKEKDVYHTKQCLAAVKKLKKHEEEMRIHAENKDRISGEMRILDKVKQEIRKRDEEEYRADLAKGNSLRRSCAAQDWDY